MQWLRRLFRRDKPQIPEPLWRDCIAQLDFLQRLPEPDLARLKVLSEALLDRKTFTGAAGFAPSDRIVVLIAAQAALPLLNLTLDLYDDIAGIIIYPSAFVIPQAEVDDTGIVHQWHEPVSGEAIDAGGAVVLSWADIERSGAPGHNVAIHEFAHKIDMRDGSANGCPPFLAAYHHDIDPRAWQSVFSAAYADFLRRVDWLTTQLPHDFDDRNPRHAAQYDYLCSTLPLDPYAAKHPAEFFAVASEAFFVLPQPLADAYPEVFHLLTLYYRQDPRPA